MWYCRALLEAWMMQIIEEHHWKSHCQSTLGGSSQGFSNTLRSLSALTAGKDPTGRSHLQSLSNIQGCSWVWIVFPLTIICLDVTDAFKTGWNTHKAALHNRNRPHAQQRVFPSAPHLFPKEETLLQARLPTPQGGRAAHSTRAVLHFWHYLAWKQHLTALTKTQIRTDIATSLNYNSEINTLKTGKKLPKMKNSARKALTYTGKFPFWLKTKRGTRTAF